MKNSFLLLQSFLLILFSSFVSAQEKDFPRLYQDELLEGSLTRTEMYIGEELWGLINGGADLYLEYGLDRTLLQEVVHKKNSYRVEIYGMTGINEAFGIFSINKFNCEKTDTLVENICITPYQLQAAVGRYYFSISNQSGDKAAQKYSLYLFESLLKKVEAENFTLPEYFQQPQFEQYQNQIKLIRGKLGLQNGFPRWDKYFTDFNNYEIVLLPIKTENGYLNIATISFSSGLEAERFLSANKNFRTIETISNDEFILIESNLEQIDIDKILN